jgi:hypothetical protein
VITWEWNTVKRMDSGSISFEVLLHLRDLKEVHPLSSKDKKCISPDNATEPIRTFGGSDFMENGWKNKRTNLEKVHSTGA